MRVPTFLSREDLAKLPTVYWRLVSAMIAGFVLFPVVLIIASVFGRAIRQEHAFDSRKVDMIEVGMKADAVENLLNRRPNEFRFTANKTAALQTGRTRIVHRPDQRWWERDQQLHEVLTLKFDANRVLVRKECVWMQSNEAEGLIEQTFRKIDEKLPF